MFREPVCSKAVYKNVTRVTSTYCVGTVILIATEEKIANFNNAFDYGIRKLV